MKLRNKFFLFISVLILVVIGSLVITSSAFLNRTLLENNQIYSSNLTDQLATSLYFLTSHFEGQIRTGIKSNLLQNGNYQLDSSNMSKYEKDLILEEFSLRLLYPPIGLQEVYLVSKSGDHYWKSNRFNHEMSFHEGILDQIEDMSSLIEGYWGEFIWFSLPQSPDNIYLGASVYNTTTIEPSCTVVAGISKEYLKSFFRGYNAKLGGNILIYNREGESVYSNQPNGINHIVNKRIREMKEKSLTFEGQTEIIEYEKEQYQLTWDSFLDKRLIICHILSIKTFMEPMRIIRNLLLMLGGIALILSLLLSYSLADLITKRIIRLLDQIDYINRGHFSGRVSHMGNDEIGLLGNSINEMTSHLNETLQKLAREEVQLKETEYRALQSEYKALQSQINPHFLYNTLESVNSLAKMENNKEIEVIITSLARLFRNSLKSGSNLLTLADEIAYVRDYITIQEKLQQNRWKIEWEVDKIFLNQPIPRFTLQPLIENAINHGMEKTVTGGLIIVHVYKTDGGQYALEVSDNGRGIKMPKLESIRDDLSQNRESEHHGLLSVHRRIRLLWGERFGLSIKSDGETGTTCRLTLPYKEKPCTKY